jgi:hypothetical protein
MASTSPNQASKRKRVLGVDTSNIIEGESRRAKRRKDGLPAKVSGSASSLAGEGEDDDVVVDDEEGGGADSPEARRSASELGHQLLDTLRKATNARYVFVLIISVPKIAYCITTRVPFVRT